MLQTTTDGMRPLEIPNRKQLRAEVIRQYVKRSGHQGVVCFSCGNASRALADLLLPLDLTVVDISPTGQLLGNVWWIAAQIHRVWPHLLDATSGHLPPGLMVELAKALRADIGPLDTIATHCVPTGSGETFVALCMAYPGIKFKPYYTGDAGCKREPLAPLNMLVDALAGGLPDLKK